MKISDIKIGMRVYDRWSPWRRGRVTDVLKTRVKVEMPIVEAGDVCQITYDQAHCQFLEKIR